MKFCEKCGYLADEKDYVCNSCGNDTWVLDTDEQAIAEEQQVLDSYFRILNYERLAWFIGGIIFTVLAALNLLFGGGEKVSMAEYIINVAQYVPSAVLGFVMAPKVVDYMNTVYDRVELTSNRCGSFGLIVLGWFFNSIAMIFIIINYARTRSSAVVIARIKARQLGLRKQDSPV